MSIQEPQIDLDEVSEQSVTEFLRANPAFFQDHTSLLSDLDIPHPVGGAISLIEYQVRILRDQNTKLNHKLKVLITNARANDKLNERLMALAGKLLRSREIEETLCVIEESMFDDFHADNVALKLFDPNKQLPLTRFDSTISRNQTALAPFSSFLQAKRPQCGPLKLNQLEFLFGSQARQVQSTALIPVLAENLLGFVSLGSHDRKRFHAGKDLAFLNQLANLFGHALQGKL